MEALMEHIWDIYGIYGNHGKNGNYDEIWKLKKRLLGNIICKYGQDGGVNVNI